MKLNNADTLTTDALLQQSIERKIEALKVLEDDMPAVIIVHDIRDFSVVHMSQRGLNILGITLKELRQLKVEYYDRYFNPEDAKYFVPKIFGLLERNNNEEVISFFHQIRPSETYDWTWYAGCTKIFLRDETGRPVLTITTATPIDAQHYFTAKVERLLQENSFLRSNKQVFASLSNRQKEILRLMALGLSANEMAEQLFISEATALTHRRNIKSKLKAQTNYDITRFAQAFDLI